MYNARGSRCKLHVLLRWKTPVRRSEEAGGRTVQGRGHRSRSRTEGSFRSRGGMDEDRLLHTKLHQSRPVGEQWGCSTRRLRPYHPSTRRAGREPLTTGRASVCRCDRPARALHSNIRAQQQLASKAAEQARTEEDAEEQETDEESLGDYCRNLLQEAGAHRAGKNRRNLAVGGTARSSVFPKLL